MAKKNTIMVVMLVLVAVMSIAYAYFATNLTITTTGNISTEWNVEFTNITEGDANGTTASNASTPQFSETTATMSVDLKVPGDEMTYELTLSNTGTIDAIIEDIDASATGSGAIIYSIDGLKIGEKLASKATKTIKVKIEYDINTTSQPSDKTKTLTVNIKAAQDTGQTITEQTPSVIQGTYLKSAISRDNIAYADNVASPYVTSSTGIDFSQISSDTNGKGLYKTSTNTEDNKTTYYFRGAVDNNYVKFGKDSSGNDIIWRIVRINEDGSIRMVTHESIGQSAFNTNYDDNAYVGYMYGTIGSSTYALTHSNDNPSTIKDYLDDWYNSNLSSYSNYLADAGFCNDRSVAPSAGLWSSSDTALGYAKNKTHYGAYHRLRNEYQPQFACPNPINDLFTTSTSSKGNKALTNPIGLLTADEVAYAGGVYETANRSMYLTNHNLFWTMSPFGFDGSFASEWYMYGNGNVQNNSVNDARSWVRPVVNLQSEVEIIGGNGTVDTPYIIKTN